MERLRNLLLAMRSDGLVSFRTSFWIVFACVALAQFWSSRHQMNPDGISYIAIAETGAVNSYWSPLYSWCMSVWLKIFPVPTEAQFPSVHAMNLAILAFTALCLEFFLSQWLGACPVPVRRQGILRGYSYVAFAWSSLLQTPVSLVTPDLLASGLFYLALALLLAVLQRGTLAAHVGLGAVLGAAYLSKTALFVVALSFFPILFFKARFLRDVVYICAGLAALVLTIFPHVNAISQREGEWTLGTSGKANYVWIVQNAHLPSPAPDPDIVFVESDKPVAFPLHFEPSAREPVRFDWLRQLTVIIKNLFSLGTVAFPFFLPLLALFFSQRPASGFGPRRERILLVPCLLGVLLYLLVVVEARYVAAFMTALAVILFSVLMDPSENDAIAPRSLLASCLLFGYLLVIQALVPMAKAFGQEAPSYVLFSRSASAERKLVPGERVAYAGNRVYEQYWAHLCRVQVAAYASAPGAFMAHPHAYLEQLRDKGITAAVTDSSPPVPGPWRDWGNGYYGMRLDERSHR